MKLLIAPWGNPEAWDKVTYIYNDYRKESYTSLHILQHVLKPDYTIIIALDTLAKDGNNYEEILNDAENIIWSYARIFCIINPKIIIAPGVGEFIDRCLNKRKSFKGSMKDYYAYIIYKLTEIFSEILMKKDINRIEVHLDLTHGINYMPTLTYRAIRELLGIISIVKDVTLKVYNSDPYVEERRKDKSKESKMKY